MCSVRKPPNGCERSAIHLAFILAPPLSKTWRARMKRKFWLATITLVVIVIGVLVVVARLVGVV
jgi:hypothetical protein